MLITVAGLPVASKKDGFSGHLLHVRFASGKGWAYAKNRHDWESGFELTRKRA
jgi:hypothetical protein